MPNIARDTFRIDELPSRLASQIDGANAADLFFVEVHKLSQEDAAKLAEFQAKVQLGIDQLDAGLGIDGETVFARLRNKHFPTNV